MSDEINLPEGEAFASGELALAVTLESVTIPDDLVGWLDGRSSLARLGLMVHVTAHRIDPGWQGRIVLEFYNSGKLPLALRPGMLIGALSLNLSPARRPGLIIAAKMQNIVANKGLWRAVLIKTSEVIGNAIYSSESGGLTVP